MYPLRLTESPSRDPSRTPQHEIVAAYGSPEDNPTFWRNASPVTFFDGVTEPILVHQGTADESCSH